MAERRRVRPNARTRQRQRRSYQPAMPPEVREATGEDGAVSESTLLERWKRKAAHARHLREDWEQRFQVEQLELFFLGMHTEVQSNDQTAFWLNHFAATVQTQRPTLLPTTLSFLVKPKPGQQATDPLRTKIQGGVMDAIAGQDGHLLKSMRLAAMQAFFRIGVLKCCYDPRMEPNPRAGEPLLNDEDEALVGQDGGQLREPAMLLTDEVYRWQWVNAKNMLLPDEGPDTTRWTWIGEEIEVTLEEAQEDPSFPEDKRRVLRGNGRLTDRTRSSTSSAESERLEDEHEQQMFRYCECWDIRNHQRYVWADGQSFDGFLVAGDAPDGVEEHPYTILSFVPIVAPRPNSWPKPVVYDWLPIQQQYNIIRTQQLNAGKRAARKIFYDQNTFPDGDEARKALQSSEDLEAVEVNDVKTGLPVVVGDGAQSPDVARNIPTLIADWHYVTGQSGSRLGNPDANTATEAVLAEQAGAVRDNDMRTQVNEWLGEAGRKMLQLLKATLTLDLWIELRDMDDNDVRAFLQSEGFQAYLAMRVGPEMVQPLVTMMTTIPGMFQWVKERFGQLKPLRVTQSELQMEADVSIVPSTVRPLYRAQLLQLTSLLGPAALMSPTLLEEVLGSFELPQGDRIAAEIMANLQRQQAMMAMGKGGGQPVPGTPQPQSAGNPMQSQNPLGIVSGLGGL